MTLEGLSGIGTAVALVASTLWLVAEARAEVSIGAEPGTGIGVESGTRVMRISMGWFGWWRA